MSLLELDHVQANYGAITALRDVSIEVPEGGIVALLGANGAGKSTTLKCISGMVRARAGSIRFAGQNIVGRSANRIVSMGVAQVPEGRRVFKDLTVAENLAMGAYTRKDAEGVEEDLELVLTLFPRLRERSGQLGASLSGGEQQMLAIGRGLMARPRLLLLDEPSLGLAPIIVADIFATLVKLNKERGLTLLIVEQNMQVALAAADYGYVLQLGQVMLSGPAEELRQNREIYESYLGVSG